MYSGLDLACLLVSGNPKLFKSIIPFGGSLLKTRMAVQANDITVAGVLVLFVLSFKWIGLRCLIL